MRESRLRRRSWQVVVVGAVVPVGAFAAVACSADLFHDTDWSSLCRSTPASCVVPRKQGGGGGDAATGAGTGGGGEGGSSSSTIVQGVAGASSCSDDRKNGTETDVDCGGSCSGCPLGAACERSQD